MLGDEQRVARIVRVYLAGMIDVSVPFRLVAVALVHLHGVEDQIPGRVEILRRRRLPNGELPAGGGCPYLDCQPLRGGFLDLVS